MSDFEKWAFRIALGFFGILGFVTLLSIFLAPNNIQAKPAPQALPGGCVITEDVTRFGADLVWCPSGTASLVRQ